MQIFFNLLFLIFSTFLFIRCVAYGIFEINQNYNKNGGISFIIFCFISILFSNIVIWFN